MSAIGDVVDRMEVLLNRWENDGDYRAVFIRSYQAVTRGMEKAIAEGAYEDRAWMEALDVLFAKAYFDALEAFESGDGALPNCWKLAFLHARDKKTTVLDDLILGMKAHIVHDLPIVLFKMGLPQEERLLRKRDHDAVDTALASLVDTLQDDIRSHYSWVLGFLDRYLSVHDEILTGIGVRVARKQAWQMAIELTDAPDEQTREALMAQLDHSASMLAQLIALRRGWFKCGLERVRRWDRAIAIFIHRPPAMRVQTL
jgi:uncharacterized protein DUF5995